MIVRFLATTLALIIATLVVPGIHMTSNVLAVDLAAMGGVAVIFGVVNSAVKPFFKFSTTPLRLVLLGAVLLVVNAALLMLTSWVCGMAGIPWRVDGPLPALIGALLVSVVSFLVNALFGSRGEVHR